MQASATVSEEWILEALWATSLWMCLFSLGILAVLILKRFVHHRRQRRQEAWRKDISRYIYTTLKTPVRLERKHLPTLQEEQYPLLLAEGLHMLRSLRGADFQRIVTLLELWELPKWAREHMDEASRGGKIQSLTLLGYVEDKPSLAKLLEYASDADMYVQITALRALARRHAIRDLPYIVSCLARSEQTNTLILADILRRFEEPAVPYLLALANKGAKLEVRIAALNALGAIGSVEAVEGLLELVEHDITDIRAQAMAALAEIGDTRATPAVLKHLEHEREAVRIQAAQAAGMLQITEALPALVRQMSDREWWVRFRAAEAIYMLGDKGVVMLDAMRKKSDAAGEMARQVLGEKLGEAR